MEKSEAVEAHPVGSDTDYDKAAYEVHSQPWWKFGGKDYSHVSIDGDYVQPNSSSSSYVPTDESVVRRRNSVFGAPEAVDLYSPPETYEGAHRFDPTTSWTKEEEKALVRRVSCCHLLLHAVCLLKPATARLENCPSSMYHVLRLTA